MKILVLFVISLAASYALAQVTPAAPSATQSWLVDIGRFLVMAPLWGSILSFVQTQLHKAAQPANIQAVAQAAGQAAVAAAGTAVQQAVQPELTQGQAIAAAALTLAKVVAANPDVPAPVKK